MSFSVSEEEFGPCDHEYYVADRPFYSSLAYRMYCRNCFVARIICIPDHIPDDQRRQYINEYVVKSNKNKDFIL